MGRCLISRSALFLLFISILWTRPAFAADALPNAELEGILQKIESRAYRWIAIRADVLLFFAKAGDPGAMCGGELLYQRLDERMFLSCVDTQQELVFAFRTLDRKFDLYLPSQNTVYHGSIFDLEDSPEIESHLKARDLYRALKPMTVDPRRTKVERTNSAITSLDVYSSKDGEETLARKLYLTPEGDVRGEIFYGPSGRSITEIQRYDFREIHDRVGSFDSIIFPKKITIVSPETRKGSAIFFSKVKPLDTIDSLEFILRVPEGTKEVFLDEKDPRYMPRQPKRNEEPVQEIYQAVPEKIEKPRKIRKPENVPAQVTAKPQIPTVKSPVPSSPAPVDQGPEPKNQEKSNNADIATGNPVSTTDAQTTLDPSVEPSLDIGKQ